jgi:hypothetical protein
MTTSDRDHEGSEDTRAKARKIRRGAGIPDDLPSPVIPITKEEERSKSAGFAAPIPDPTMYAGILGELVRAAEPTTEADPAGIYASLLAMAGAAIGYDTYVQIGNTRHPLLIWPLLFGGTGSGRKGEATNTAATFFRSAYSAAADFTVQGLSSGEGLIERIRDIEDENDKGGTEDKRLLVIEPEFVQVMARAKREGSTLAAVLRQAWDGGALSVLNRAHLKAAASHVVIIGHITPDEFRIKLAEADMAGGTYNRFLPFFVERSKRLPLPAGLDREVIEALAHHLELRIRDASGIRQVTLDADAIKLWKNEIYEELTTFDDESAAYAQFIQRAAPYCRRVAALHAVLDGRHAVSGDDMLAAAAAVRYAIGSARYVLGHTTRNPDLDKIRRFVSAVGPDGVSRSEISGLFSRNKSAATLDALLVELTADGQFEKFFRKTSGRPAEAYRQVGKTPDAAA